MLNSMMLSGNMWTTIINFFADWIVNYGWAIVVFTICLKLVLAPLDILQRVASNKQARVNNALKPEMDALQAKYGNNREKLNQEQNKLYKKYNVNMAGICLPMLISLVLTLVIFFTLFSSIRSWGNDNMFSSYNELDKTYVSASINAQDTDEYKALTTDEEKAEYVYDYSINAVKEKYDDISKRNSWLWIKNVWKSDTNTSQFVDFDKYAKHLKLSEEEKSLAKERYNAIVGTIQTEEGESNGYYILIVLAALVTLATQLLSAKLSTPSGQKLNVMNKVMMAVLPISMFIFAMTSNAVFTLYIITNSIMSAIISTILTLIMRKKNKNSDSESILLKKKNVEVVEYSRNYKK